MIPLVRVTIATVLAVATFAGSQVPLSARSIPGAVWPPVSAADAATARAAPPATAAAGVAFTCRVHDSPAGLDLNVAAPDTSSGDAALAAPIADPASAPAAKLRATVAQLLAEHAFLTLETMRAVATRAPEQPAVAGALGDNSATLQAVIASVYGPSNGDKFGELWRRHITDVLAYATAVAGGDEAGKQRALDDLAYYKTAFAALLGHLSRFIDPAQEAQALQLHIDQLLAFTDSNYDRAYLAERNAFMHMFEFGDQIARALAAQFPKEFAGGRVAFSPAANLRLTLDRLLGEHAILSAEGMRVGLTGSPDGAAVRGALDGNSTDLQAAIGQIYGDPAAAAFGPLWRAHIDAYYAYIQATASGDASAKESALATLHAYPAQLAAFLSSAITDLPASAVEPMLAQHIDQLVGQVDAYAAHDYSKAIETTRAAYARMFMLGEALARAISRQFPDRFQDLIVPNTATTGSGSGASTASNLPSRPSPTLELPALGGIPPTVPLPLALGIIGALVLSRVRRLLRD